MFGLRCIRCHERKGITKFLNQVSLCSTNAKTGDTNRAVSTRIPNSEIVPKSVHNRNPRNLERLRIGEKPIGWNLDKPGKSFWNKVILEVSSKHVSAKIKHYEGFTPVSASTREWSIKSQLYSSSDVAAVETVARVLARRALETGISEVFCQFSDEDMEKPKVKRFVSTLEESGLILKEPDQICESERTYLHFPTVTEKAWETFEELDEKVISKIIDKRLAKQERNKP